jgi:hypothetical protein
LIDASSVATLDAQGFHLNVATKKAQPFGHQASMVLIHFVCEIMTKAFCSMSFDIM